MASLSFQGAATLSFPPHSSSSDSTSKRKDKSAVWQPYASNSLWHKWASTFNAGARREPVFSTNQVPGSIQNCKNSNVFCWETVCRCWPIDTLRDINSSPWVLPVLWIFVDSLGKGRNQRSSAQMISSACCRERLRVMDGGGPRGGAGGRLDFFCNWGW